MLTRPHRQVLATMAVLAFTVTPTAYVISLAFRLNRPGHIREAEVELGRRLGVLVTLEGVRYPRPGEVVYRGVTLRQEEGGRKASRLAEIARADVVWYREGDRELVVQGLRLRAEGPKQAMAQVATLLRHVPNGEPSRLNLTARTCRVELGDGLRFDLRDLAAQYQARGERRVPTVTASYVLAAGKSSTRCELSLGREPSDQGVRTSLAFQTMEGPPLPARVLDPFFDSVSWLGASAKFDGTLTLWQSGEADWEAEYKGNLLDVDLDALVGRHFPDHRVTGLARLSVESSRWGDRPGGQGSGWIEARGALAAGPGTISASLLQSLEAEMRFRVAPSIDPHKSDLEYESLGLSFAILRDGQLRLSGALGPEFAPGTVLVRGDHLTPLAFAPSGVANVRGLWKTLVPAGSDVLVPATAESQFLRHLPLPPTSGQTASAKGN